MFSHIYTICKRTVETSKPTSSSLMGFDVICSSGRLGDLDAMASRIELLNDVFPTLATGALPRDCN